MTPISITVLLVVHLVPLLVPFMAMLYAKQLFAAKPKQTSK